MIGVSNDFFGAVCPVLPVVVIDWHCVVDSSRLLVFGAFGGVFRLKPA